MRKVRINYQLDVEGDLIDVELGVDLSQFTHELGKGDIIELMKYYNIHKHDYNDFSTMNLQERKEMFCDYFGVSHCTDKEELIKLITESF